MTLNNGLNFYTYGSGDDGGYENSSLVSLVILFAGGLTAEYSQGGSKNINGVGSLFASVWTKSSNLLPTIEHCGGSLDVSVSSDYLSLWISIPSHHLPSIQSDLEAFLLKPTLQPHIFDTEKTLSVLDIQGAEDSPRYRASKLFRSFTYAGTPYSLATIGTESSVGTLTLDDIHAYYSSNIKGAGSVAVLVGSYPDEFRTFLAETLGAIPSTGSGIGDTAETLLPDAYDYLVKESYNEAADKHTQQAKLFMAWDAPAASDVKGFFATKMLDGVLSTGMSSPYFKRLRDERGYAYAVSSQYSARRNPSRFVATIGLDYSNTTQCIQDIIHINSSVSRGDAITPERLEVVYNTIASSIMATRESVAGMAFQYALFAMVGVGSHTLDTYLDELKRVTVAELMTHAESIFSSPKTVFILKPASPAS